MKKWNIITGRNGGKMRREMDVCWSTEEGSRFSPRLKSILFIYFESCRSEIFLGVNPKYRVQYFLNWALTSVEACRRKYRYQRCLGRVIFLISFKTNVERRMNVLEGIKNSYEKNVRNLDWEILIYTFVWGLIWRLWSSFKGNNQQ